MNNGVTQGRQIKLGAILSYFQMALSIVIGLCYTPVMLRLLGESEYGLYNTVSSTISMLSVLSLGFNSSYIRYFAQYKVKSDRAAIEKLNGLYLLVFVIIGIISFLCGLFLAFNLEIVFSNGLTSGEFSTARILMIILSINLAVSFPMSVFQNIISAHENYVFIKSVGIIKTVISPLITVPLLLMGYKSIALVMVTFLVSMFADVLYVYYVLVRLKQGFDLHKVDTRLLRELFVFSLFIAINMIVDQINWNIDKMLLARYRGTSSVAIYSVGFSLYQYYKTLSTSISGVFTPRIHTIINRYKDDVVECKSQITALFIKVGRVQYLILGLVCSGVVLFGKQFVTYWAGPGYNDSYYVAILLIVPASVALIQNLGIEIQRAINKHMFRSVVYSIMAVLNLAISIILCQRYGAIGSAIGTAISLVFANGIVMNIYYYKKCHIDIPAFWKNIIQMSKGLIMPITFGKIYTCFIPDSMFSFIFGIISYSIIYILSMWFWSMNQFERELVTRPICRVFHK